MLYLPVAFLGIFLAKAGSGGCVPGILAYVRAPVLLANSGAYRIDAQSSNNVVSHTKRGVTAAVVVSFSGLGGIVATTIFRQEDAPRYMLGIYTSLGCQALLLALLGVTTVHFKERNIQVQQCPRAVPIEGKVGFEYTL